MLKYERIQSIFGSSLGNILEWYDFGLFAVYSPLFSRLFFPTSDKHASLMMIFGIFAVGFICRPLGALLFGYLGDRHGRASTLRLSILMISIPTLLIGFLPTYSSVGIWAPIFLIIIRLWQGISLGGEYSGNLIYLVESAPKNLRASIAAFAPTTANIGILLATCVSSATSYFLSDYSFELYGWRIPYLISGALSLFIYFKRLKMKETETFLKLKNEKRLVKNPIKFVFKNNREKIGVTIGLACMGSTFYYLCFIYMPTFLMQTLRYSFTQVSSLMTFFIAMMVVLVPLAGKIGDKIGRKKMLLFNAGCVALLTIPAFHFLLMESIVVVIFFLFLLTMTSSLEQATTCVAVVENFPPPARYTGLSIGYNISNALFGGTAPLVCEILIDKTHYLLAPSFYVVGCALLTGCIIFFFVNDTSKDDYALSMGSE